MPVLPPGGPLRASPATPFDLAPRSPEVDPASYVDARASVIGDVRIAERVYVAPLVSVRADGGAPVAIGAAANLQDGVVIHGVPAQSSGTAIPGHSVEIGGQSYSVYVGARTSLDHQAQLHGPVWIEDNVWIGMQALVSNAHVGADAVLEPRSAVIGVQIAPGRVVPAGAVITTQEAADQLAELAPGDPRRAWSRSQVDASTALAAELLAIPER
jgi:carbonic anhydrase